MITITKLKIHIQAKRTFNTLKTRLEKLLCIVPLIKQLKDACYNQKTNYIYVRDNHYKYIFLRLATLLASTSILFSHTPTRDPFTYITNSNKKNNNALLIRATIECPNGRKTTVESYENGTIKKIPSTLRLKG